MQPLNRPAVVVFDLDGTIEDSRLDMVQSINRVRASYGLGPVSVESGYSMVNKGMEYLYKTAFEDYLKNSKNFSKDIHDLENRYLEDYALNIANETRLYTGIETVLTRLAEHLPLILYTNKPEKHSRLLLSALEIQCFDEIIGGDSYLESKPASGPVETALSKIAEKRGQNAGEFSIAMVGDTSGDMKIAENLKAGGRKTGQVRGIWVSWGYSEDPPEDPKPDFICNRPDELIQLLV